MNNQDITIKGTGSGMLAAFTQALENHLKINIQVIEYGEHALSQESNAEAVTYLQLKFGNTRYTGIAINEDIVTSSVNALLNAVSQIMIEKNEAA